VTEIVEFRLSDATYLVDGENFAKIRTALEGTEFSLVPRSGPEGAFWYDVQVEES
jgi:hypothetical protein